MARFWESWEVFFAALLIAAIDHRIFIRRLISRRLRLSARWRGSGSFPGER